MQEPNELIIKSRPNWVVKSVEPQKGHILNLIFASGERKVYDCKPLFGEGVFTKLKNPVFLTLPT